MNLSAVHSLAPVLRLFYKMHALRLCWYSAKLEILTTGKETMPQAFTRPINVPYNHMCTPHIYYDLRHTQRSAKETGITA